MKNIQEWQKEFSEAISNKFPNNDKWSEQDRLLAILRQLADVSGAIQKDQGLLVSTRHAHENSDHRIAVLVADILALCEKRNIDLEKELDIVLDWYKK